MPFYGQLSCTPGRPAAITGRLPIRSGTMTVAFPRPGRRASGRGVDHRERPEQAGYTCQIGKWHLGEADYSMLIEHGFDEMYNTTPYYLNAYTLTGGFG